MRQRALKATVRKLSDDKVVVTAVYDGHPEALPPLFYIEFNLQPNGDDDALKCAIEYARMKFSRVEVKD